MQNIFVCGCGHSGTSLIAAMLGAHPEVYAINFETGIFREDVPDATVRAFFAKAESAAGSAAFLCEKSPLHVHLLDRINGLFPEARIVIPVRDPRDVGVSIRQRTGVLANGIDRWNADNGALRAYLEQGGEAFVFRYEDLIENPRELLISLCGYIGLNFSECMLDYHKDEREWFGVTERVETSGFDKEHSTLRNWQIHQPLMDRRGRWRQLLSPAEVAEVEGECADLMAYFGYRPSDAGAGEGEGTAMERVTVICMATADYVANWLFCINSHQAYCARHGYDYALQDKTIGELNAKWSKLAYARDALASGHVLLIDADAWISPEAPRLETLLAQQPQHSLFVVNGISNRPNSGVMLLRGGDEVAKAFLETCLAERDTPVPAEDRVTAEGENGHVISILKREPFASRTHILDLRWNCTLPEAAADAHVRHYTNRLRQALFSREGLERLAIPVPCASTADAEKRAAYRFLEANRGAARERMDANPAELEAFRRQVTLSGQECGITFPRLVADDAVAWLWRHAFAAGLLERPSLEILRRIARPGSWVMDAGAHVGYFSRHLEAAGCRVVAVEAHPANVEALRANTGPATTIVAAALAGFEGEATLHDGRGHSNSSLVPGGPTTGRTFTVPARTIDGICDDLGIEALDILKIDIEGMEPDALMGAQRVLARSDEVVILCEINPRLLTARGVKPDHLVSMLFALGFVTCAVSSDFGLCPFGVTHKTDTMNYLIARPQHWARIFGVQ